MLQGYKRKRGGPSASSCMLLMTVAVSGSSQLVSGFHQQSASSSHFSAASRSPLHPRAPRFSRTNNHQGSRLSMSSPAGQGLAQAAAGVTVRLDQPLMSTPHQLFTATGSTAASSSSTAAKAGRSAAAAAASKFSFGKLLKALGDSKIAKLAAVTFCLTLVVSLSLRVLLGSDTVSSRLTKFAKMVKGRTERIVDRYRPTPASTPMPFEDENEGWGICSLKARKRLGKTQFLQFDFELPKPEYTLPLDLGQQISLCCLDNDGNVARGSFFPFYKENSETPGSFSILAPNIEGVDSEESIFRMGLENANFIRVIKEELKVGDEIALTPGDHRLSYKGQYLPVTDMVYIAYGTGIVPVLEQIRSVLPSGASSVSSVTVVWVNESARDFDVLADMLEKEYFKYSEKLAVSCIVGHVKETPDFAANDEINSAIPDFTQGSMAVLAGPTDVIDKATFYLEDRGYPLDTICTL